MTTSLLKLLVLGVCTTLCACSGPRLARQLAIDETLTPESSDVYDVVQFLNEQKNVGTVDSFQYYESPDYILAWKTHPEQEHSGWLYKLGMKGYLYRGYEAVESHTLPPAPAAP